MKTRLFILPLVIASLASASAAQDGPRSSVRTETVLTETTVDLQSKERPLAEVLDELARKMGFAKIHTEAPLEGLTFDGKFEGKPAWECMTAILKKHKLTFGGGKIGEDYALALYPDEGSLNVFRVSGGLVARFSQVPVGTVTRPPRNRPFTLQIKAERQISWTMKEAVVWEQKNARGDAANLMSIEIMQGRPQAVFGKDDVTPWPGLSFFAVNGTAEFVTKKLVADTSGFSIPQGPHAVKHGDEELFVLDGIKKEGNFIDFHISFASTVKGSSVIQGGWGSPVEDSLEEQAGARLELLGVDGTPVSPILCFDSDGTRAKVKLRYTPHLLSKAGGIEKTTLRFCKPMEKATKEFSFEFDLRK